jgi:hypothetical protein
MSRADSNSSAGHVPQSAAARHPTDAVHAIVAAMHPDVPECAGMCRANDVSPHGARRLSLAQHAAIRLLAQGRGSVAVAAELGLNRHTVARWKRDPSFQAALEGLRNQMNVAVVTPALERARQRAKPDPLAQWLSAQMSQPLPPSLDRDAGPDEDADRRMTTTTS